jgi:glycosyltransferase 2 family protein
MPDPKVATPATTADDTASRSPGKLPSGRTRYLAAAGRIIGSRPVKWGFVVVAVTLAGYVLAKDWPHIRPALGSLGFLRVAAAMVCVLLAQATAVQTWRLLLGSLGSPLPVLPAARVLLVCQLGKYVPGSIWPVVASMELGKAYQVPRSRSGSASVLAMLVTLMTGLLAALITLPFVPGAVPYRWALLVAPALLVMMYPRILNAVIGRLLRLARQPPLEAPLTGPTLLRALCWGFGTWICYGLQIWILATKLGAPPGKTALIAIGGFAFAWTVGFIVVFAPAGAGVRDVLLLLVLSLVLSTADATAVMLTSRLLLTAGDLLSAGVAAKFIRRPDQVTVAEATPAPAEPAEDQQSELPYGRRSRSG